MSGPTPLTSATGQPFKPNGTLRSRTFTSLSTRIDNFDAGLSSVEGAREVIEMIASCSMVARLLLGSNDLGNDGTITLFEYLGSDLGKKYKISEICLNSNGIGDSGLLAIARYLNNNPDLKALFLPNNLFAGNPPVTDALASAINSSGLERISLTGNRGLADSFVEQFLFKLDSPNLREIHLSGMGLTSRSTPHIVEYVSSPRCRLHTFKSNGNCLGFRSVRLIIRALEQSNFGLLRMELDSNQSALSEEMADGESGVTSEEDEEEWGTDLEVWKESEILLKRVLLRNSHLGNETKAEALRLLRFARGILLQPNRASRTVDNRPNDSCSSLDTACLTPTVFPFLSLPTELQLHMLSFLAPTLSPAQRVRIYTFASSPSTLPTLLCLPDCTIPACTPSPSSASGKVQMGGGGVSVWSRNVVVSQKEEERAKWLDRVGCCVFEPGGDWDGQIPGINHMPARRDRRAKRT